MFCSWWYTNSIILENWGRNRVWGFLLQFRSLILTCCPFACVTEWVDLFLFSSIYFNHKRTSLPVQRHCTDGNLGPRARHSRGYEREAAWIPGEKWTFLDTCSSLKNLCSLSPHFLTSWNKRQRLSSTYKNALVLTLIFCSGKLLGEIHRGPYYELHQLARANE